MSATAYQYVGPVGPRRDGICAAACVYDEEGVCDRCGTFDSNRYLTLVFEFPTAEQDSLRKALANLDAAGIEVRRV